jgi:branched-chain amino acid transport system substrate-binding protein
MRPMVAIRVTAIVVTAGVFAGCSPAGDLFAGDEDPGPPTAKVVVLVPQDGSGESAGIVAAVELAVQDRAPVAPGWTLSVLPVDEASDAATTATRLADDDDVVAVVGGLSDRVVRTVQPVLAGASILFVSPADVAPEHTRGSDPTNPLRPYVSYFRTTVADADEIKTAADYAVGGLGAEKIAVVDGGGSDETARFTVEVRRLGAEIVASARAGADRAGIAKAIAAAVSKQADVVYTAGDTAIGTQVAKSLASTGLDAHLVGGAALHSVTFLSAAGTAADGAVAVVAPTRQSESVGASSDLVARLTERGVDAAGPLAAAAYDAGAALAQALSRCLPARESAIEAREQCIAEMQQVSVGGLTGEVAFDAFGDRVGSRPQVYEVRDGAWVEVGAS